MTLLLQMCLSVIGLAPSPREQDKRLTSTLYQTNSYKHQRL